MTVVVRSKSVASADKWAPRPWAEFLTGGWRKYLVGPDARRFVLYESHPDFASGIYFLFDVERLLYVGLSLQVTERVDRHHRRGGKRFTDYSAVEVPPAFLEAVETAYIHALSPPLNESYRAPWRAHHDEMVASIRLLWGPKLTADDHARADRATVGKEKTT